VPDLRLDIRRGGGDLEHGLAAGTRWADVPMNWTCPECGARKEDFEMVQI
jgi:rubredoxin